MSPIRQTLQFNASPERIYQALLDASEHSSFTGAPAEVDASEGGAFAVYGGHIEGRTIELIPNARIVQAWRAASWEAGAYSIVRYDLKPTTEGTELTLEQSGMPEGTKAHLDEGWKQRYWGPLRIYLGA